jgi:hypothetical protein
MRRDSPPAQFLAQLSGTAQVPAVATNASGVALFGTVPGRPDLRVRVTAEGVSDVTAIHVQLGRPGETGPVVAVLYAPTKAVSYDRESTLTNRTLTGAHLTGPLKGLPMAALTEQMAKGNAYVNVRTVQYPDGEVRGQIVPVRS